MPSLDAEQRRTLEQDAREVAEALAVLAGDLGDRETRQSAADRAFAVATTAAGSDAPSASALGAGVLALRILAVDVMVFAGVESDAAVAAVREGILERSVAHPPGAPRGILGWLRSRLRR